MQIYDAGALIAADRGDRAMWVRLKATALSANPPVTSAAVIGQVWRGNAKQARLARLLKACETVPLTEATGCAVGALLGLTGLKDVVDAALVLTAGDGDTIFTSDPDDIGHLAGALGLAVKIVPV